MNMHLGDTRLLIEVGRKLGLLRNEMAYVLATTYHETGHTMKPCVNLVVKSTFARKSIIRMSAWAIHNSLGWSTIKRPVIISAWTL